MLNPNKAGGDKRVMAAGCISNTSLITAPEAEEESSYFFEKK